MGNSAQPSESRGGSKPREEKKTLRKALWQITLLHKDEAFESSCTLNVTMETKAFKPSLHPNCIIRKINNKKAI